VSPPHRPREDELAHPADASRTNLAAALGVLSRWLSITSPQVIWAPSRGGLTGAGRLGAEESRNTQMLNQMLARTADCGSQQVRDNLNNATVLLMAFGRADAPAYS
jgi:hypothetical protein